MGGYSFYVWAAYGLVLFLLVGLVLYVKQQLAVAQKKYEALKALLVDLKDDPL